MINGKRETLLLFQSDFPISGHFWLRFLRIYIPEKLLFFRIWKKSILILNVYVFHFYVKLNMK